MTNERIQRRLAAILAADVVGYSRLMERDEGRTLAALKERRKTVLSPLVAQHQGRVVKVMGDGVLVEFASAVNAVECAIALQARMAAANESEPEEHRIVLRMASNPTFTVSAWIEAHPFADDATRQHFMDGYRKAELPD